MLRSFFAVLTLAFLASAQSAPEAPPRPAYKFLSGSVVEFSEDHLVVRRSALGRTLEIRKFGITPETKIEGDLRLKARVTVGYTSSADGDAAVRVIVRTPAKRHTSYRPTAIGRTSVSRAVS